MLGGVKGEVEMHRRHAVGAVDDEGEVLLSDADVAQLRTDVRRGLASGAIGFHPHPSASSALPSAAEPVEVSGVVVVYPGEHDAAETAERERRASDAATKARAESRRQIRRVVLLAPLAQAAFAAVFTVCVSFIYLSPIWDPFSNLGRASVAFVNADAGWKAPTSNTTLNFGAILYGAMVKAGKVELVSLPAETPYNEAREHVRRNKYWGAVFVPKDLTAEWAGNWYGFAPNQNYSNSMWYISDPAKQYATSSAAEKMVTMILKSVVKGLHMKMVSGSFGPHAANTPTEALVTPLAVKTDVIHVMKKNGWSNSLYISFMFMYIGLMMAIGTALNVFHRQDVVPVGFAKAVFLRYFCVVFICVVLAGVVTAIFRGFGFPAANGTGAYWGIHLLVTLAWSGYCIALQTFFGSFGTTMATILLYTQIVSCDGIYSSFLMAPGWRFFNKVFPLGRGVAALRWIAFDTLPDDLGWSVGVLLAWAILGNIVAIIGMRWGRGDPKMKVIQQDAKSASETK